MANTASPKVRQSSLKTRPCFGRVKTGCLSCRRRKKKCDEVKPRCAGCRRNQIPCDWPSPANEVSTPPSDSTSSNSLSCPNRRGSSPGSFFYCSGKAHASDLTSVSQTLLRHYLCETGALLLPKPINKNPFITHVLPLACSDDTLMHAVLALSGTHLAYKAKNSTEVEQAALTHYAVSVHSLREELLRLRLDDGTALPRILLITIVLCHYELISGDLSGKLYPHLQACRTLVQHVLSNTMNPPILEQSDNGDIVGFCLELYAWLILANSVTPFGTLIGEELPYDYFIYSLGSLSGYSTFGSMFRGVYELFEMIPRIAIFGSSRLAEEDLGCVDPSSLITETYHELDKQITEWELSPFEQYGEADKREQAIAAECMRHALQLYLITSYTGSQRPDAVTMQALDEHVQMVRETTQVLDPSPHICYLLWALLIAGSCMTDADQQQSFVDRMHQSRYQMRHIHAICDLLQILWDDPDPQAFGPYGLHRLKQQGYWVPVC